MTTQSKDELKEIFTNFMYNFTISMTAEKAIEQATKDVEVYTSNQVNAVLDELLEKSKTHLHGMDVSDCVSVEAINAMKRGLK